jgi:transposase
MSRRRAYPSDLTDAQWALIEPLLPPPRRGGRPEKHPRRAIVDAVLYVVRTGCSWRQLPADFPPWQTVYWYFVAWEAQKVTHAMLAALRRELRTHEGRAVQPSAGIIDSQSVKGADTVGRRTRGYDAGKKVNGRKRFIVTDTMGLLIVVVVVAASVQDRDGAKTTLIRSYAAAPRVRMVFADGAFAGRCVDWAAHVVRMTIAVVRKPF